MINTSSGEGWGLPAVEGFSIGVNQLVPDWSATREIWNPESCIPTLPHGFHYSNVNTLHGRISITALANRMAHFYPSHLLVNIPTWPVVASQFDVVINKVLNSQHTPIEMYMNEVIEGRTLIQSEAVSLIEDL